MNQLETVFKLSTFFLGILSSDTPEFFSHISLLKVVQFGWRSWKVPRRQHLLLGLAYFIGKFSCRILSGPADPCLIQQSFLQWVYYWGSSGNIPIGRVCVCSYRVRLEMCILNLSHPGEIWSSGTVLLRSYAVESPSSGRTHGVTAGWVISLLICYNEVQSCPRHDLCHPLPTLFGIQSKMQCL